MERQEIIKELKEFFKIQELVSGVVYRTFSEETCWSFFRTEFLHTLLIIRRDIVKSPLTCNDYDSGGTHTQRGLRENTCALVRDKTNQNSVYVSAHSRFQQSFCIPLPFVLTGYPKAINR